MAIAITLLSPCTEPRLERLFCRCSWQGSVRNDAMTEASNTIGSLRHRDSQDYFMCFAKKARIFSGCRPK